MNIKQVSIKTLSPIQIKAHGRLELILIYHELLFVSIIITKVS